MEKSLSIPRKLLYMALIPILFMIGVLIGILIVGEMGTTSKILSFFTVIVVLFGLVIYAIYSIIYIGRSKEKSSKLLFMVLSNGIFPFAWVIVNHLLAKFGII